MPDSITRDTALAAIEKNLAPLIGESMARSSVRMHCQKLGLNGGSLDRDQVTTLLTQIGMAMRVFVGAERADALTGEIQSQLFEGRS